MSAQKCTSFCRCGPFFAIGTAELGLKLMFFSLHNVIRPNGSKVSEGITRVNIVGNTQI